MKQVNFSHSGGFPLEQETLERLQTAYRSELYEALKGHLSIESGENYIISPATESQKGWAVIHQFEKDLKDPRVTKKEGILYPINKISSSLYNEPLNFYKIDLNNSKSYKENPNNFALRYLKTTRIGTDLIYGTGTSEMAYFDYEAKYISATEFTNAAAAVSQNNDALTVNYYDLSLKKFEIVKDIKAIEKLISDTNSAISALSNAVTASLALKADKTEVVNLANSVTTSLALKADKTEVTSLSNAVNNSLAFKADKTEVTSLSNAVTTSLALKADKTTVLHHQDGNRYTTDFNTLLTSGFYNGEGQPPNAPGNYGQLIVAKGIDTGLQVFGGYNNDNLWFRGWANYGAQFYDWRKIYHNENLKTSPEIIKLKERMDALEKNSGVPKGMIAIWGKPAPFPEGWEEYVPLRGRMPVGLKTNDPTFDSLLKYDGNKEKKLEIDEMPEHNHSFSDSNGDSTGTGELFITTGEKTSEGGGTFGMLPAGKSQPFSIMNPYSVVYFIEYTGRSKDITAPSAPIILPIVNVGRTFVTLNWIPSNDDRGITNYLVFRDDNLVAKLDDIQSFNVGGLSRNRSYDFYIKAQDAAGNLSDASNIVRGSTHFF
jgi:hypothetical protein